MKLRDSTTVGLHCSCKLVEPLAFQLLHVLCFRHGPEACDSSPNDQHFCKIAGAKIPMSVCKSSKIKKPCVFAGI